MRYLLACAAAGIATALWCSAASAYTGTALYKFCHAQPCRDGAGPGGVVVDQSGNLFGVTTSGGANNEGTVFELVPSTGEYTVLYDFCNLANCGDGAQPGRVNLVIDTKGNLYGTASSGGNGKGAGVVFELLNKGTSWQEKVLYEFCSKKHCKDGSAPRDGLTFAGAAFGNQYDGASALYGATYQGATAGTVFSLAPKSGTKKWTEQVLYRFCSQLNCIDGSSPDTPLYLDSEGNIYGTTFSGGQENKGTVFELSPSGSAYAESVPYSFCVQNNCADGALPRGGVTMDASGNLYGTTEAGGGSDDNGLLFELSPNGSQWNYQYLETFNRKNGSSPQGQMLIDAGGNLFGTTATGGANKVGTVFEFSGSVQTLYSFCARGCNGGGEEPLTGVVEDGVGNFYGVTNGGGFNNAGTVYKLSP